MNYLSTRGEAPALGFEEVLLAGLARDGGLYVPEAWPALPALGTLRGLPYAALADRILSPFVAGAIQPAQFVRMLEEAAAAFQSPAVTPLSQIDERTFLLELFHGPTLAFKDVAMQLLGRMFEAVLARTGSRLTIIGATSGDTGSAAMEALRGRAGMDVFILHPLGRVSEVQRRQMTTMTEENVHALAIEGTFDDCQAIVKALFGDLAFRDRVNLSGVNSINWARIMPQIVYYVAAALALGVPGRRIAFSVPTGNFGDIYAGYAARCMGLPVERLVIATNVNDILARTLETGRYEMRGVTPTLSPSMDIQVSSNFERLLFDAYGRDPAPVRLAMDELRRKGAFAVAPDARRTLEAGFAAGRTDEEATLATIARV
ncbi:MAG: threonine synthase, partial [Alphaproteobacteria bacterium]|nr:threonine synthase [Alphaproteobacteria bacterium]